MSRIHSVSRNASRLQAVLCKVVLKCTVFRAECRQIYKELYGV